jgi:hypothetical protein
MQQKKCVWGIGVVCVCVCVWERERERGWDGDSKTLMMNDTPNIHGYCGTRRMMGHTKIKLQIPNSKPITLKWLCLMDFNRLRKIAKSDCYLRHVRLSVQLQQLSSVWENFKQIWYLSIFRKFVKVIQISLQSANNNRHFMWRTVDVHDNVWLNCF